MTVGEFAEAARVYCMLTDGSVTSWGRTRTHNQEVGGVPFSAHRFWLGADVVYDAAAPVQVRTTTAERLGLKVIAEGDHDHLQPLDWPPG